MTLLEFARGPALSASLAVAERAELEMSPLAATPKHLTGRIAWLGDEDGICMPLDATGCANCRRSFEDGQAHFKWDKPMHSLPELAAGQLRKRLPES